MMESPNNNLHSAIEAAYLAFLSGRGAQSNFLKVNIKAIIERCR